MYPYKTILPYFSIPNYSSIPVIFSFLFLLSSFLFFFFFFFLSLLFSLIRFCSLFLQDQNEIFLFWSYPYLILSLFLFHFQMRKLPPSFLQAICLFHNFLPYFILISFFYYSLVLQFSITFDLTYAYSYFGI